MHASRHRRTALPRSGVPHLPLAARTVRWLRDEGTRLAIVAGERLTAMIVLMTCRSGNALVTQPGSLLGGCWVPPKPPPLPHHLQTSGVCCWLVAAVVVGRVPPRREADEEDGVDGVYMDRKGVRRRTGLSASFALSSALGSPRSSLETNPVARIASPSSPRFAACSMSASESLYRSRTMHSD